MRSVGRTVGEVYDVTGRIRDRVWVEEVVDVHAVDVVAPNDVAHDGDGALGDCGVAGVHPQAGAVDAHEVAVGAEDVRGRQHERVARVAGVVRVEPRVQLEAARVRLVDREREGVVARIGAGRTIGPGR